MPGGTEKASAIVKTGAPAKQSEGLLVLSQMLTANRPAHARWRCGGGDRGDQHERRSSDTELRALTADMRPLAFYVVTTVTGREVAHDLAERVARGLHRRKSREGAGPGAGRGAEGYRAALGAMHDRGRSLLRSRTLGSGDLVRGSAPVGDRVIAGAPKRRATAVPPGWPIDGPAVTEAVAGAYSAYHAEVAAYVRRLTREAEVAEDLAQETFLRLQREMQRGRTPTNPRAWLYRVAGNLAMSRGRHVAVVRRRLARPRKPGSPVRPSASCSAKSAMRASMAHSPTSPWRRDSG
jgi:DNA-directed RNA polymerase specialized sigma24 family protein